MDSNLLFCSSIYLEQETKEDEELSAFTRAVADVFGPQQARLSEKDWLDESDSMDTPPLSTVRNWRAVSIAASFRLAPDPGAMAHLLSNNDQGKRQHFSNTAKRRSLVPQ
jgi:hypothetical protein